jgi:hypothetical protein
MMELCRHINKLAPHISTCWTAPQHVRQPQYILFNYKKELTRLFDRCSNNRYQK